MSSSPAEPLKNSHATSGKITILASAFIALLAFAANSILCRMALDSSNQTSLIDPAAFTVLRLGSGALMLFLLFQIKHRSISSITTVDESEPLPIHGSWRGAIALFVYAICFSYAYVELDTGIGALILFGSVQITMVLASALAGQKLHSLEIVGLIIAFSGFVYLVSPGLMAPPILGFLLMALSGIAWAAYTLIGRNSQSPFNDTTFNFLRTLPLLIIALLIAMQSLHVTMQGVWLAILSGTLASGAGYSIWYFAVRGLSRLQAGVMQLLVPIFAAIGGVIFVDEQLSLRLSISFIAVIVGVLMVLFAQKITRA